MKKKKKKKMIDCPPTTNVFHVERITMDDRTLTTGEVETSTRLVLVDYIDNRNAIADHFWSFGAATLVNTSEEDRRIRYQQRIQMPDHHWVDTSTDERACYDPSTQTLVVDFVCEVSVGSESAVSWVFEFPVVPYGDLNLDGRVDAADIGLLLASWGRGGAADIDQSGKVDSVDLGILLEQWSQPK